LVSFRGKNFKGLVVKLFPARGEKMIVKNIDDHAGIMAVFGSKSVFAIINHPVAVSKRINSPVKFHPPDNPRFEFSQCLSSFYKITNKIAQQDLFIISG
jgi:hypothetical protein